jgi:hypothetical protein
MRSAFPMNLFPPLTAALLALLCTHSMVQAQVLRCEDAQGKVTYTDASCPHSKEVIQVVPAMTAQERAQQDAQYQQALQRKQAAQLQQAERDAAQQQAEAARAAAQAAKRLPPAPAPVIVQVPASEPSYYSPPYLSRPPLPPHVRPPAPKPQPPQQAANCNVFRCYDGKGNTWARP